MCVPAAAVAAVGIMLSGGRPPVIVADAAVGACCQDVCGRDLDQGNGLSMLLFESGAWAQLVSRWISACTAAVNGE